MARRLFAALVTVWLAATSVFLIFFVLPGGAGKVAPEGVSPVAVFLAGRNNSPETLDRIQHDLGLDQPLPVQYGRYISSLARGHLGYSYSENDQRLPVRPVVMTAVRPTAELALGASVIALGAGIASGVFSIRHRHSWSDRTLRALSVVWMSIPTFVVGVLVLFICGRFDIAVQGQYQPMSAGIEGWVKALWVPWFVLALPFIGIYFRVVRTSLLEVANEDFIRTARAKGLSELGIERHQLRAGFMPLVTAYGVDLASFLGGSIIVESIFDIPGLGSLALAAIEVGDFPIVAAVTIVGATAVVLVSLVVDLVYAYLNPLIVYVDKS